MLLKDHIAKMKAEADSPALRGVFSTSSAERLDSLVDDALDKGARVLAGSRHVARNVVQPLVLAGVTPSMRTHRVSHYRSLLPLSIRRHLPRGNIRANHHSDVCSDAHFLITDVTAALEHTKMKTKPSQLQTLLIMVSLLRCTAETRIRPTRSHRRLRLEWCMSTAQLSTTHRCAFCALNHHS